MIFFTENLKKCLENVWTMLSHSHVSGVYIKPVKTGFLAKNPSAERPRGQMYSKEEGITKKL